MLYAPSLLHRSPTCPWLKATMAGTWLWSRFEKVEVNCRPSSGYRKMA